MIGDLRIVMPIDFDRYDCQNSKLEFNAYVVADPERFDCPLQTVEQIGEGQDARQWNWDDIVAGYCNDCGSCLNSQCADAALYRQNHWVKDVEDAVHGENGEYYTGQDLVICEEIDDLDSKRKDEDGHQAWK